MSLPRGLRHGDERDVRVPQHPGQRHGRPLRLGSIRRRALAHHGVGVAAEQVEEVEIDVVCAISGVGEVLAHRATSTVKCGLKLGFSLP